MGRFKRQDVQIESIASRCKRYREMFELSDDELKCLREEFNADCRQALRHHRDQAREAPATLKYLDTCVDSPPSGTEQGIYYAIDFGGTNLRVVRVELDGNGGYKTQQTSQSIRDMGVSKELPKGLMDPKATATQLFDGLAGVTKQLMEETGDLKETPKKAYAVGFTFSFPLEQTAINSGSCPFWTKGFETGRDTDDKVEGGPDICQLLDSAFRRCGVPARCAAALNDTTGTLLSSAYSIYSQQEYIPPCVLGVILGTGMNAAYYERSAKDYGYQGLIINTEMGGYNRGLKRNIIDLQVDLSDIHPGVNVLEKMCSSLFVSELCRRALLRMFAWDAPERAWVHYTLNTEACMAVAFADDLEKVREVMEVQLDWKVENKEYLEAVRDLFKAILGRSANLLAVAIASLAKQTGKLQQAAGGVTVGIDGSMYIKNPQFQNDVSNSLQRILGEPVARLIHIRLSKDGSGLGAAVLAACEERKGRLTHPGF